MWALRGAQSAAFYYLSCAPCSKYSHRKKRRRQNKIDRKAREALELDDPDLYRQPSPYATNEFWTEEINHGPNPSAKRSTKKSKDAKIITGAVPTADSTTETSEQIGSSSTMELSAIDGVKNMIKQAAVGRKPNGERWSSSRFQREDEHLWGFDYSTRESPLSRQGLISQRSGPGSFGMPGMSRMSTAETSTDSFFTAKNPPLNDLHPPVVSKPTYNKIANSWMLQPPPNPQVMDGYEPANRSRSASAASSRRSRETGEERLQRKVSARLIAEKLKRFDALELPDRSDLSRILAVTEEENPQAPLPLQRIEHASNDTDHSNATSIHYGFDGLAILGADSPKQEARRGFSRGSDSGIGVIEHLDSDHLSNSKTNDPSTSTESTTPATLAAPTSTNRNMSGILPRSHTTAGVRHISRLESRDKNTLGLKSVEPLTERALKYKSSNTNTTLNTHNGLEPALAAGLLSSRSAQGPVNLYDDDLKTWVIRGDRNVEIDGSKIVKHDDWNRRWSVDF